MRSVISVLIIILCQLDISHSSKWTHKINLGIGRKEKIKGNWCAWTDYNLLYVADTEEGPKDKFSEFACIKRMKRICNCPAPSPNDDAMKCNHNQPYYNDYYRGLAINTEHYQVKYVASEWDIYKRAELIIEESQIKARIPSHDWSCMFSVDPGTYPGRSIGKCQAYTYEHYAQNYRHRLYMGSSGLSDSAHYFDRCQDLCAFAGSLCGGVIFKQGVFCQLLGQWAFHAKEEEEEDMPDDVDEISTGQHIKDRLTFKNVDIAVKPRHCIEEDRYKYSIKNLLDKFYLCCFIRD